MKRWIDALPVLAAIALATGCGAASTTTPPPPASQIAPGSAAVPCSQITSQIRELAQLYMTYGPGNAAGTPLYGAETALAGKFSNVSNLDSPQALANAEVNFVVDVGFTSKSEPWNHDVNDDIGTLESACGIST
jgi:hypothetical protein